MKSSLDLNCCCKSIESNNSFLSLQEDEKVALDCEADVLTTKVAVLRHVVMVYLY